MTVSLRSRRDVVDLALFIAVGLVNTIVGVAVIFTLSLRAGWSPIAANAGGYAAGLLVSYILNRYVTFARHTQASLGALRFIMVFLVAYGVNLGCLKVGIELFPARELMVQAFAIATHTLVFFVLCRVAVFRPNPPMMDPSKR